MNNIIGLSDICISVFQTYSATEAFTMYYILQRSVEDRQKEFYPHLPISPLPSSYPLPLLFSSILTYFSSYFPTPTTLFSYLLWKELKANQPILK